MKETGQTYFRVAMNHAIQHREYFLDTELPVEVMEQYRVMAADSLENQQQIEANDTQSFDDFLASYYQQYDFPL